MTYSLPQKACLKAQNSRINDLLIQLRTGKNFSDNLPKLQNLFTEFGAVRSVKVIKDMFSRESKGFGLVEMPGLAEAQKAMNSLNTKDVKGKKLVVNEARPKTNDRSGGGSRGGSGGGNRGFGNRW